MAFGQRPSRDPSDTKLSLDWMGETPLLGAADFMSNARQALRSIRHLKPMSADGVGGHFSSDEFHTAARSSPDACSDYPAYRLMESESFAGAEFAR